MTSTVTVSGGSVRECASALGVESSVRRLITVRARPSSDYDYGHVPELGFIVEAAGANVPRELLDVQSTVVYIRSVLATHNAAVRKARAEQRRKDAFAGSGRSGGSGTVKRSKRTRTHGQRH